MSTVVQRAIHTLLTERPFYGHFILNSNMLYDKFNVPTAGVAVIDAVPTFIFNTEWLSTKTAMECADVLEHEVLHLVFDHLDHLKDVPKELLLAKNIATDCAINQYLSHLPDGCVTLDQVSRLVGYALDPFETSAYYFSHLMKKIEELEASGMTTMDEHGVDTGQGESSEGSRMNQAAVKAIAKKALGQAAGNAPQAIVSQIGAGEVAALPWKQLLRNFVMRCMSTKRTNTTKKINRRFPLPIPGKKKKRELTVGLCLDESGSMSDEQLRMVFTEVKAISKQVTKVWVIHADSEVALVEDLSKVDFKPTRRANGGTAYQPAITKCVELGCDVIMYFGDFDSSDVPVDPKKPFLWIGVGNQKPPADFGKVLRLPG